MDISHWDAAIHYGIQLAQYCDQTRSFNAISRRSPPVYSLALRLRNTKVPVSTHESIGYPKKDISHWDAAIHYGVQLAQYCDQTLSCYAISRRLSPLCSLALRLRNTKVPVWTHESIGYPKWTSAIGTRQFTMAFSLPNIVIRPDLLTLFHGIRPLCTPCPKTQEHQSTCVDSWVHRVPENGHQPLGRGNSLWRSACPILWSNPFFLRTFRKIVPSVLPCPKTQEHQSTCVDSWVHRVPENGHQPLGRGNSLWRSACPILWSNPILLRYFTKIVPPVLPCPKTQEHQSTCVDSWVHWVPENGHQPLGRGNSLWHSACPILWSTRSFNAISRRSPPVYSLALRLRNTKVPVWTHESIGYPKMDISHWDAAIHYGIQLAQYCDQTRSFNAISRRSPPVYSLALRLRNTKVPVWTHESIGYPKMDISHWDAAIHYGVQLAQYCDQTLSFYALSRRLSPLCSLALRLRNTKVPVWTHESIGYPKMDISHWDAAIHYGIQLAQYCDQTRSFNAISRRSPPVYSLALRLRNTKVPVWTHESIGYPKMDISHWDAAIHYGVQLAQYCDQTLSCYAISRRLSPPVLPCPKTQEHQSTCVDSWVHRVPENGHQPLGRGNSLWHSACPILWSNPIF